jgi:hypothetical protein
MEYDIAALELVGKCASARLSEAESAVLTLLLLLEGGKHASEEYPSAPGSGRVSVMPQNVPSMEWTEGFFKRRLSLAQIIACLNEALAKAQADKAAQECFASAPKYTFGSQQNTARTMVIETKCA